MLQSVSRVSLAPLVFKRMLKFPETYLVYKGEEVRNFLKGKTKQNQTSVGILAGPHHNARRFIQNLG
jgi:hypothetical protein